MVRVKICGITNIDDALMAVAAGADALGFVFHPLSPRNVTSERVAEIVRALPPFVQAVGLFVDAPVEVVNGTAETCGLDLIQLHGDETPEYCSMVRRRVVKAIRVRDIDSLLPMEEYRVSGFLLDAWSPEANGGTGMTFNWDIARRAVVHGPVILAGGLTPENIGEAVQRVSPYGVDVSSGVEAAPGRKDPDKVLKFISRAKGLSL